MTARPHFLIGLTGMPGSGKDTVATAMRAHGYHAIAFADALRVEIAQAWRMDTAMFTTRFTQGTAAARTRDRHVL